MTAKKIVRRTDLPGRLVIVLTVDTWSEPKAIGKPNARIVTEIGERAVIKIAIVAVAVTGSETVMRVATVTETVTAAPSAIVEQIAKLERSRETGTVRGTETNVIATVVGAAGAGSVICNSLKHYLFPDRP